MLLVKPQTSRTGLPALPLSPKCSYLSFGHFYTFLLSYFYKLTGWHPLLFNPLYPGTLPSSFITMNDVHERNDVDLHTHTLAESNAMKV